MPRTPLATVKKWIVEGLEDLDGSANLHDLVAHLESKKSDELVPEDRETQPGHPKDTKFKYYCRWAVTVLRGEGVIKRGSPRATVELEVSSDSSSPEEQNKVERKQMRGKRRYGQTCGELLETYIRRNLLPGQECRRSQISTWFASNYPLFKPVTVQAHIEKYTTNFRSRAHYAANSKHDLLFRIDNDWNRLRLYQPGIDPEPIYEVEPVRTRKPRPEETVRSRQERLLGHFAEYGELSELEKREKGIDDEDIYRWIDCLLVAPRAQLYLVTPLFIWASEPEPAPARFASNLAVSLLGRHLNKAFEGQISGIEDYVWEKFGCWQLEDPRQGDEKWHAYLRMPVDRSPADVAAERLDLFAHLPADTIGKLVRDPSFLSEQQSWSALACDRQALGPLSRQIKQAVRRPLFLSNYQLPPLESGEAYHMKSLPLSHVVCRRYVVSGLDLCNALEWEENERFDFKSVADRILRHPLYALLVQFLIQEMFAGISGDPAPVIQIPSPDSQILKIGDKEDLLWDVCRRTLIAVGYWPTAWSSEQSRWQSSVQAAIKNLSTIGVLEVKGQRCRLTESYESHVRAQPGHFLNRGEKLFRSKLVSLVSTPGGQH